MYSEYYSQVRAYNAMSPKFNIVGGVRQGSIFSPYLFNLTIDWIMEQVLSKDLFGITLDNMMVAHLVLQLIVA